MMGNVIDLTKKARIVLEKKNIAGVKANIVLAIDKSGSMSSEYSNGTVQETVDRLLGIGMNMDTDKSIDVYTFNTGAQYIGAASESNHKSFVKDKRMGVGGGTSYAPVMHEIINKYGTPITPQAKGGLLGGLFGKKEVPKVEAVQVPTFVFFVTDGDNSDKQETIEVMTEASKQGIFWQFVGIGYERFAFLQKLDDLSGRYIDNADFFAVNDIMKMSDEELYERLLTEFPSWLSQAKAKGLVL